MKALIFIGRDYENFSKESKDIGVNRRVPLNSIAKLEWGTTILCAKFEPGEKPRGPGKGQVIGEFKLTRLSIINPEIYDAVTENLRARGLYQEIESPEIQIKRFCGEYILVSISEVGISLPRLVTLIRETGKRLGISPKIMIGSDKYTERDFVIPNIKFTRAVTKLLDETEGTALEDIQNDSAQFVKLSNYQQKGSAPEKVTSSYKKLTEF